MHTESVFKPLKTWFTKTGTKEEIASRKSKFGRFPLFWKGLKTWQHYESVYSAYTAWKNGGVQPIASNAQKSGDAVALSSAPATSQDKLTPAVSRKRKRKSRWAAATNTVVARNADKSSRWSMPTASNLTGKVKILPSGYIVPAGLTMQDEDVFVYKIKLEQLKERMAHVPEEAAKRDADPDRSPSPAPLYNMQGIRTNSRLQRMTEACEKEEEKLMIGMLRADPKLRSLYNYKIVRKVFCPVKEFPDYNFIGLVLGPRGATQKEMEGKTGCKIAIRGKGSIRAGRNVRQNSQHARSQNEDLHVLITGDDIDMVERTIEMVKPLLRPLDDDRNLHKQRQLRQLALINGTLRESTYCNYCGEEGHAHYNCPKRKQEELAKLKQVRCARCGEVSHVTRDCKYTDEELANKKRKIEGDYADFIANLSGSVGDKADPSDKATANLNAPIASHNKSDPSAIPILNAVAANDPPILNDLNHSSHQSNTTAPPILNYGVGSNPQPAFQGQQARGVAMPVRGRGRGRGRGSAEMMKPAWMIEKEKEAQKAQAQEDRESSSNGQVGRAPVDLPKSLPSGTQQQQQNQFAPPPQMNTYQPPHSATQQNQFAPPPGNFAQPPPQYPIYGMYQQQPPSNKYAPDVSDWNS